MLRHDFTAANSRTAACTFTFLAVFVKISRFVAERAERCNPAKSAFFQNVSLQSHQNRHQNRHHHRHRIVIPSFRSQRFRRIQYMISVDILAQADRVGCSCYLNTDRVLCVSRKCRSKSVLSPGRSCNRYALTMHPTDTICGTYHT